MKGKLHKSMNYGWMIQDETGFYPLYPYDLFTNSIERVDGKEVDFTLVYSWNAQEEKLIEVAIISANKQETLHTEQQVIEIIKLSRQTKEVDGIRFPIPKYTEQEIIDIINQQ